MSSGHFSTLEHASYTFAVDGVSRALTHQLVRHRIASFNQQSQRYVKFTGDVAVVKPESIAGNAECIRGVRQGHSGSGGRGLPCARSRRACPPRTRAICCPTPAETQDRHHHERSRASALLRACAAATALNGKSARWRDRMLELARPTAPFVFADAGAPCVRGTCPEGKMTCGNPYPKVDARS